MSYERIDQLQLSSHQMLMDSYFCLQNIEVGSAIYGILWYLLPSEYQRDISRMVHHTQHGPVATIGPLGHINFETVNLVNVNAQICRNFIASESSFTLANQANILVLDVFDELHRVIS